MRVSEPLVGPADLPKQVILGEEGLVASFSSKTATPLLLRKRGLLEPVMWGRYACVIVHLEA